MLGSLPVRRWNNLPCVSRMQVASGRRKAVCPYYAARGAAAEADLLLVPYGALLTQVSDLDSPAFTFLQEKPSRISASSNTQHRLEADVLPHTLRVHGGAAPCCAAPAGRS